MTGAERWGVVQMITTRTDCSVTYEVTLGDALLGDRGEAIGIWQKEVFFGHTDATLAGGPAFVAASREQQSSADDLFAALRGGAFDGIGGSPTPDEIKTRARRWLDEVTRPRAVS
jgi:hypothetical protein